MSTFSGNRIVRTGLVLNLDPANIKNYTLRQVEVLVVAGGGSGGASIAGHGGSGGGGAGGLIYSPYYSVTANTPITVTIGAGGTAATPNLLNNGNNGANTVFGSINAVGGGYGAHGVYGTNTPGGDGGSGGGGGYRGYNNADNWGLGTSGQGNNGGGVSSVSASGGGGGGAGGAGNRNTGSGSGTGGLGGSGLPFIISGSVVTYATGGNGGASTGVNGIANSGNGGSGTYANAPTYAGGSGIVIVRYNGPQKATGGTITKVGNDTVHTFTTSGVFTPFAAPVSGNTIIGLTDINNGIFGTAVNNPTYNSNNGGSIVFSNSYLTFPFTSLLDISTNLTTEMFLYPTAYKVGSGGMTITKTGSYYCELAGTGIIRCYFYGLSAPGYHGGNTVIPLNQWTHVAVVRNSAASTIEMYVNGILDRLITGIIGSIEVQQTFPLTMGSYSGGGYDYTGRISSGKIYNRALSAAEIAQNFDALRGRYGI